jgi:hypothetical protein
MGRENASTGDLFIESSTTGTDTTRLKIASNGDLSLYEDTGTTPKFFWDASAESLGIGTSTFTSASTGRTVLEVNGASASALINLSVNGTRQGYIFSDTTDMNIYNVDNGSLNFGTNNALAVTIDASGQLRLGNSTPTWDTTFSSLVTKGGFTGSQSSSYLYSGQNTYYNSGFKYSTAAAATLYEQSFGVHTFYNAASGTAGNAISWNPAMTLDASGNVGIGCVPQAKLDIDVAVDTSLGLRSQTGVIVGQYTGAPAVGNRAQIGLGYGNTYTNVSIGAVRTSATAYGTDDFIIATKSGTADTAPTERLRVDASGNLLVGISTDPSVAGSEGIELHGSNGYITTARNTAAGAGHHQFINTNGLVGTISTTGSATTYGTSSDYRLKENIADADDAGSKIDAIQVRKFDWKVDGSHQDYGMVAQELLEIAPSAVSASEDPDEMMGVDYSKLVPMMLKEIQSLRARIAALES